MADLAAAADGTLAPARLSELEALAAEDEHLAAALEQQRRAVALIRGAAGGERAPLALRRRLEAEQARQARQARARASQWWLWVALLATIAVAVLLAVVGRL